MLYSILEYVYYRVLEYVYTCTVCLGVGLTQITVAPSKQWEPNYSN